MSDTQVIKEMMKSLLAMEICLFRGYTFIYIVVYI